MRSSNRIVFVAPSLGGGGAERVAVALSHYFISRGFEFTFLLTKSPLVSYDLPERVTLIQPDLDKVPNAIDQLVIIRKHMRLNNDAVYLSFMADQNLLMLLASIGLKLKTFVSVRNIPERDFKGNKLIQLLRNMLYERCDGVILQLESQGRGLSKGCQDNSIVIPNPISDNIPCPRDSPARNVIATSGRLVAQKNHRMTLRAFKMVLGRFPEYRLEVYGTGPLEKDLRSYSQSLGIANRVDFMGFKEDALEAISTSAVFVLSSYFEGMPHALLEAMSMGVPSVAARCDGGGAEALIQDGVNGMLVNVDDDSAMAKAIIQLLESPAVYDRISATSSEIRKNLTLDKIGAIWERVLFGMDIADA